MNTTGCQHMNTNITACVSAAAWCKCTVNVLLTFVLTLLFYQVVDVADYFMSVPESAGDLQNNSTMPPGLASHSVILSNYSREEEFQPDFSGKLCVLAPRWLSLHMYTYQLLFFNYTSCHNAQLVHKWKVMIQYKYCGNLSTSAL